MISLVTYASDLYSASNEDLEIVFCFLDFHETKEFPNRMQYTIMDLLVRVQEAQSAS